MKLQYQYCVCVCVCFVVKDDDSGDGLWILADYEGNGDLKVVFHCCGLELASILVADLCTYLDIKEMAAQGDFESDMNELRTWFDQVNCVCVCFFVCMLFLRGS